MFFFLKWNQCQNLLNISIFLLVVVVNGEPIEDQFYFRDITRCNTFAYYVSTGKTKINNRYQMQENITAYCIPKRVAANTKTWD